MTDELPAGSILGGRYRVERTVGRGGMGIVYEAFDERASERCAIKLLHPRLVLDRAALSRFRREARITARLESLHVVRLRDVSAAEELDGAPFLVMDLLEGRDFARILTERGKLPPDEVLECMTQVARGVGVAHAAGIVHRDLKPENLFLHRNANGSSIVKVLDFGLSKLVATEHLEAWSRSSTTAAGAFVGTPVYMAPEQLRAREAEISPRTDVWAVGLITLHLLTGEIYWRADSMADLVVEILVEPFTPPSARWRWLSLAFDEWVGRSCARDPAARFASVGEQIDALRQIVGGPEARRGS